MDWHGFKRSNHNKKGIGELSYLRELIKAATIFLDEKGSIFKFGDVKITPLLKEIEGYIKDINLLLKKSRQKVEVII